MSRPRLVHVTTTDMSLDWLLGPQLSAFADAGYEVWGASASGPHVAALEARGVRHVPLRQATRSFAPHRDLAALVELWRVFRRLRPAIVHTHNPKPGVYGRLAARAAGVRAVVNTQHGLYATEDDAPGRRALVYGLERLAAAASHAELVQSVEDLHTLGLLRVPPERLHLLGNGIDLERFDAAGVDTTARDRLRDGWGAGPTTVVVGAVGRLVREKGYPELFEAWARLGLAPSVAQLVVIGPDDPDKADALEPSALREAEASGVRFLGRRDDMTELYAAMDVYVLASHREGFPRSAMEAAAMGLPVIATDVRGCRQVVDGDRNGLLVPARDASAMVQAIRLLVEDAGLRARLGTGGRLKAERDFDQRRVIELTLAVYASLLGDAAPAPRATSS